MREIIAILLKEKRDIAISVVCGFIAAIAAVGLFSASGYLISKAALVPPIYTLMIIVASVKLLGIISAVSKYGERYFSHRATFTMLRNVRKSFYGRIEPLAPQIFQRFRSGDLLARVVGDVESLQNFFLRVFYPPIVIVLTFLVTIALTSVFSVAAAIVIFIGLLVTTLIVPAIFAVTRKKVDKSVREKRGELSTETTEFLQGYRDLRIYQQLDTKKEVLLEADREYVEEQSKETTHQLFSESANTFISLLVSVIVLGVGSYLVTEGQLDGIFLAMLLMISLTVFENTTEMAAYPAYYQESKQATERLDMVIRDEKERQETEPETEFHADDAIEVSAGKLTYQFSQASNPTLKDIDFNLPKGSKTAIVGPSGSGKSTLLQLLMKISKPTNGDILFDGKDYRKFTDESIWKHMNVILQANHFFYGTIRENLVISGENIPDGDMLEALEKVHLSAFQLDDQVLEKGENLSGGEKQRLAIARTLLRKTPLWLLDEPTSSMDAVTEAAIYKEIFSAAEDATLVLVSHRLTGLEEMDQILVIVEGEIIERGTYAQLMTINGYFKRMKEIEQSIFEE